MHECLALATKLIWSVRNLHSPTFLNPVMRGNQVYDHSYASAPSDSKNMSQFSWSFLSMSHNVLNFAGSIEDNMMFKPTLLGRAVGWFNIPNAKKQRNAKYC